jgi:ubiquinone/menaquinone biosynthesis C-methylase UbiE
MPLYDFLAPSYDLAFEKIYLPFRRRALARLDIAPETCVLDLACGTGQNFPILAEQLNERGHLIGLDVSRGMLRRARRRALALREGPKITLIHADAVCLTPALLETEAGVVQADLVLSTYSLTAMRDPGPAFHASWNVLRPGGTFLIHDIHASERTLHARAVEAVTRSNFSDKTWRLLAGACPDFRMDYLDPSAHLFGGRLFVAWGTKPVSNHHSPCPS